MKSKIYLSSYRIPDIKAFCDFVGKEPQEIRFGLISNAKDHKNPIERKEKIEESIRYFSGLGLKVEEINLLDYANEIDLRKKFKEFDVLWFNGGNTYCLRYAIKRSGTDNVIREVLNEGIVYAGDSAGAIVTGPTLKYFDRADDSTLAPEVIYEGLGLVKFTVLPHWSSPDFDEILKTIKTDLEKDGYETITMTDRDYLLIEDGEIKIHESHLSIQ